MKARTARWIAPTMIILFIVSLMPFFIALNYSFRDISYTSSRSQGQWVGLDNYRKALSDPEFIHSLGITFKFLIPAVLFELILGFTMAMLFSKSNFKGIRKLIPILIIPTIIAPVVIGLIGRLSLNSEFGVIGVYLRRFGIIESSVLGSIKLAMPAIILIDIWQWTPFVTVILLAGFLSFPKKPFEAAAMDGATPWQTFKHITMPFIAPLLAIVTLLRSIEAFKIFDKVWIMTQGGPGVTTQTSNVYAYRLNFMHWKLGYGAAIVILLYIVSFLLCVLFFRYLNREQIKKEREVIFYGDGSKKN
ncbi:Melibiose/raffinose/stachyose import permease protein MelD [subsurface metagenome]